MTKEIGTQYQQTQTRRRAKTETLHTEICVCVYSHTHTLTPTHSHTHTMNNGIIPIDHFPAWCYSLFLHLKLALQPQLVAWSPLLV
eukprot:m.38023 g.38023  ORF g.38023 m.38023 type:complete len:86 (+) comp6772_c0_seq3:2353-2610(+)